MSIFPASNAPSDLPAPTIVCSSSINKITRPSSFANSFNTALSLSSNSPRNFAPATNAPISKDSTRLFFSPSGTSKLIIRCAKPSTIAVLPTPGSPINTGLFLVRRCKTCNVLRISSSRPITGSNLPCSANSVRSIVYLLSACRVSSALGSSTVAPPRTCFIASLKRCSFAPNFLSVFPNGPLSASAANKKTSDEIYLSLSF